VDPREDGLGGSPPPFKTAPKNIYRNIIRVNTRKYVGEKEIEKTIGDNIFS